ncbi:MAG: DUF480 domain-containing protein [Thermogutta sp.]|nr:DUF480 domain-containing protein [Thermogutta sp.]
MSEDVIAGERQEYPGRGRTLSLVERRVFGVLIEKAKTTPAAYPLTLNAIITACNQKSNRDPVMQVDEPAAEAALETLRRLGAVGVIQGSGRVDKYRHYAYEWLGVDKLELSVLCELLLRGPQTEGELRSHVSRMEPIPDLPALRTVLDGLEKKGLLHRLTPPGRGHTVTHSFHLPQELERIRARFRAVSAAWHEEHDASEAPASLDPSAAILNDSRPLQVAPSQPASGIPTADATADPAARLCELERQLDEMRAQIAFLKEELQSLRADLSDLRRDLGA